MRKSIARHLLSPLMLPVVMLAAPAIAQPAASAAEDVSQFYAGRQVRIVVGVAVGSGYDTTARILGRHIGNHIPGKPQVIVSNQPGAGSLTMTHSLYSSGPKDGTVIGAPFNGLAAAPLLTPEQARFEAGKLNWIGSTAREAQVTYTWHTVPIRTIEDIRKTRFVVGSQQPGSSMNDFAVVANKLLGTQFNVINGYESHGKIHLAMEAGEVHGLAAVNWTSAKLIGSDWMRDKKIHLIAQWALQRHPELKALPMWTDVATSPADKQALELLLSRLEMGRPYFVPPDVPAARVTALRRAFDATVKDAAFVAEATKARLEIDPMTGEEIAALVARVNATPADVVARVRNALAGR